MVSIDEVIEKIDREMNLNEEEIEKIKREMNLNDVEIELAIKKLQKMFGTKKKRHGFLDDGKVSIRVCAIGGFVGFLAVFLILIVVFFLQQLMN